MTALAYYMIKMVICSGILFLYYHLALRNKVFHQYNRFYLLFAVVLSLVLPLIQFNLLLNGDDSAPLMESVQAADNSLEAIVVQKSTASWQSVVSLLYTTICFALLFSFVRSLYQIVRLIRTNAAQTFQDIRLVNTNAQGTPFSFLQYIFWNEQISLTSETGQQIFQHELAHVKEKHTLDKLFLQVVLILFWCNPFFWLIRRELRSLHEFIADKKAIANQDSAAFAAMILQAVYAQQFSSVTNPFFQSSIKRRMHMLTKIQNPHVAYAARLAVLPLFALTIVAFTVRTKKAANEATEEIGTKLSSMANPSVPETSYKLDTIPAKEIKSVNVMKDSSKKVSQLTITYKDGTSETLTEDEARAKGYLKPKDADKMLTVIGKPQNEKISIGTPGAEPLVIVDGKEMPASELKDFDAARIESMSVLKGETATSKYGDKAKNGVIIVTLKSGSSETRIDSSKVDKNKEVVVIGYGRPKAPSNFSDENGQPIFERTETPPTVDKQEWRVFLEKNLQPFIEAAASKGANPGNYTVNVRFIVKKDGSLSNFEALNDPGYDLAKSFISILPNSPKWKPAMQNGHPVNSYHIQPVTFVIQEVKTKSSNTYQPNKLLNKTIHQLTGLPATDQILSCSISVDDDNGDVHVASNSGDTIEDRARKLLQAARKGNTVWISEVVVKREGKKLQLPANFIHEL